MKICSLNHNQVCFDEHLDCPVCDEISQFIETITKLREEIKGYEKQVDDLEYKLHQASTDKPI